MRRLTAAVGVALLVIAMTAWELYEFFVTNEGVNYYASDHRRLLYVALITAVCGVGVWVFFLVSPARRRGLRLLALGLSAAVFSVLAARFAWTALRFLGLPAEMGAASPGTVALLVFMFAVSAAMAVLLFFVFANVWRKGAARSV